jgi:hypothetical protein
MDWLRLRPESLCPHYQKHYPVSRSAVLFCEDQRLSWLCRRLQVNRTVIEKIGVGVVAVDFKYLRDEPATGPALDVNDHAKRSPMFVLIARWGSSIPLCRT